ncbi:hypothetical protein E1281_16815 [Actinomadura sp. KC345]|nr:hypothetical protein E1281_16815 [Actinomadura sp. KC345]
MAIFITFPDRSITGGDILRAIRPALPTLKILLYAAARSEEPKDVSFSHDESPRIAYVDNDPVVLAHARAMMVSDPQGESGLSGRRHPCAEGHCGQ